MKLKAYDPRDPKQVDTLPDTWMETENPALIAAHLGGVRFHETPDMAVLRLQADYCDELIPLQPPKPPNV